MPIDNVHATLRRIAEAAMIQRGFLTDPPAEVLAEVQEVIDQPDPAPGNDLSALPWTSIDNPESRDLDQIEAVEQQPGGTRLYVGIADVDHFVARDGPTDRFAGHNTTSVYTGARTFPMLPDRLSSDRTSLLGEKPRRAVVIETLVRPDGTLAEGKIYPARVENHAKLDYPAVSAWLDGQGPPPASLQANTTLRAQLSLQDALAQTLREARRRDGALDVDTCEIRPVFDAQGRVTALLPHGQDRAGQIIEELMIASNRTVAHALDSGGMASIRRVVRQPERWAQIVRYAGERGSPLPDQPDSLALSRFVQKMRDTHGAVEFSEISLALIKLMGRGEYVAHLPGRPEIGHFGLATSQYTHATAPNRRYPDLCTQRLLLHLYARRPSPYTVEQLQAIADHCTVQEAAAQKVERRVRKSVTAMLMAPHVGQTYSGIVTGASNKGTYLRIIAPPVEGKIVRGERGLRVGDTVRARLHAVSVEQGYVDFEAI